MQPLVYIILVNWNGWKDTISCIDSLLELDYCNFKILVVDNGSSNNSIDNIRRSHPLVNLIATGKNLGFAGGVNVGIRHALNSPAEFLWLLNNDTKVAPDSLSHMVKTALDVKSAGAIGATIYCMNLPSKIQAWGGGQINLMAGSPRHRVNSGRLDYITGASMLLRRTAIEDIGLFDSDLFFMYWEDTDFCIRLKESGWDLICSENAQIWHKEGGSREPRSPLLDAYFDASAVHFLIKHTSYPLIPILIGAMGRFLKRLIDREWSQAFTLWPITFNVYVKNKFR